MNSDVTGMLTVEVAFAMPDEQRIVAVKVPPGTGAMDAAMRSGIEQYFAGLVLNDETKLGIFSQVVAHTQVLNDGDRVEIYRPLTADPKEARKARAARAKARRESEKAASEDDPGS